MSELLGSKDFATHLHTIFKVETPAALELEMAEVTDRSNDWPELDHSRRPVPNPPRPAKDAALFFFGSHFALLPRLSPPCGSSAYPPMEGDLEYDRGFAGSYSVPKMFCARCGHGGVPTI